MIDPLAARPSTELSFMDGDKVVLCEGRDECALLRHLTKTWPVPPKIGTRTPVLNRNWEDEFRALAKQVPARGLAAIGFVFDAEKSTSDTEKSLTKYYSSAGFTKPNKPLCVDDSVIEGVTTRTLYLINPHDREMGSIESLFVAKIKESPQWHCIEELLRCYETTNRIAQLEGKVIVRTYLSHSRSNTGLQVALEDGLLSCDGQEFDAVRQFLELIRTA